MRRQALIQYMVLPPGSPVQQIALEFLAYNDPPDPNLSTSRPAIERHLQTAILDRLKPQDYGADEHQAAASEAGLAGSRANL
jgi:hypothetical protein